MLAINIALGRAQLSACTAADVHADGRVTIDDLVAIVGAALTTCR
jgi:hypothetical protein